MERNGTIVRGSAEEVRQMLDNGGDQSDWAAAMAMPQAEVERLADEEDGPLPEDWQSAVVIGLPVRKQAVNMRLDEDVLAWFRMRGPGYQTRINAVLRSFVQAKRRAEADTPKAG